MIHTQLDIPRKVMVACSGGVDSMASLDFIKNSGRDVSACFFDHGTETSKEAWYVVAAYCSRRDIPLVKGSIHPNTIQPSDQSLEEFWRNERYRFFLRQELPVITGYNLDDVVEWWIFTSLHGEGKITPGKFVNVLRPFRLTRKTEFINWCRRRNVEWHEDYSNDDVRFMRNFIRKELLPKALVVNPGLHKVLKKKVESDAVTV